MSSSARGSTPSNSSLTLRLFGQDRLLVLIADDLKTQTQAEVQKVCGFLGVDQGVPVADLDGAINTRDKVAVFPKLRRCLAGTKAGAPVVNVLRNSPVRSVARKLMGVANTPRR